MIVVGIYLDMKWVLANVIMVVESKRWYEPLRRSAYLVNGVILSLQLLSSIPVGLCLWYCYTILGLSNFSLSAVYYSGLLTLATLQFVSRCGFVCAMQGPRWGIFGRFCPYDLD